MAPIAQCSPGLVTSAGDETCRILQITDLHFFREDEKTDQRTIDDVRRLVEATIPDLLMATGDLWHDNPNGQGMKGLDKAVGLFQSLGVPWAVSWGNHDLLDDFDAGHRILEESAHSAYHGGRSHGDYRIEVHGPKSLAGNDPLLDLYVLNSNSRGIGPWQVKAFEEMSSVVAARRKKIVPSLAFFHIPLVDYRSRMTPANFKGVKLEDVTPGEDDGSLCGKMLAVKGLRAAFCGHDHVNDYSISLEGLDLVFGRATGHAGYGGEKVRKGAKVIDIKLADGSVKHSTVFADGSKPLL